MSVESRQFVGDLKIRVKWRSTWWKWGQLELNRLVVRVKVIKIFQKFLFFIYQTFTESRNNFTLVKNIFSRFKFSPSYFHSITQFHTSWEDNCWGLRNSKISWVQNSPKFLDFTFHAHTKVEFSMKRIDLQTGISMNQGKGKIRIRVKLGWGWT